MDRTAREHDRPYSLGEEISHSVTHGVGIVLSIAGLAVLVAFAALRGGARHVVGCAVFGSCLVLLYTASTVYHAIPLRRAKRVLRILDHSAIYLLIAGTYTPFALVTLRGVVGWSLLAVLWVLAVGGIVAQAVSPARGRWIALGLYLGMGWSAVLVIRPLYRALEPGGFALLCLGGAAYTLGVAFYLWRGLRYHHLVWHLFVLAGSLCHYFTVLFYVVPRTAG